MMGATLLCGTLQSYGQFSVSPDTVYTCPQQSIKAKANFIPPGAVPLSVDDAFGPVQNLGFTFNYFGNPYTQIVASGNNFITFNTALANGGSSYIYNTALGNGQINRAIMFPFQDTNPATGIATANPFRSCSFSFGDPGSRKYVVQFCEMPLFSCASHLSSSQVVLHEGTDIIDIHIINRPAGCTWNGGTAVIGLRDAPNEVLVPGRNLPMVDWGDQNKTYRFTPNGAGGYTLDSLPYQPVPIIMNSDTSRIFWYAEGDTINPVAIGQNVEFAADENIKYFVAKYDGPGLCTSADTVQYYDTLWVKFLNYQGSTSTEICQGETYNFYGETIFKAGKYEKMLKTTLGCDSLLTLNLIVNPLPDASIDAERKIEICDGLSKKVKAINPQEGYSYVWYKDGQIYPGSNAPEIILTEIGTYLLEVTSNKGCISRSNPFEVYIRPNPIAKIESIGDGEIECTHDTIKLVAFFNEKYDYKWWPENALRPYNYNMSGHEVNGVFRNNQTDMTLTVLNEYGCIAETNFTVNAKPCCDVFLPNAFTPNGDGNNDIFAPKLNPTQQIVSFEVFDRYGALVYRSNSATAGWDGTYSNDKDAPPGVYMYQIIYTCDDGQNYTKKESITLMR
jgi:gliding motility-associated-like protein